MSADIAFARFERTVIAMGATFRDKFDFSSDEDFGKWAKLSIKAADSLLVAIDERCPPNPEPVEPVAAKKPKKEEAAK